MRLPLLEILVNLIYRVVYAGAASLRLTGKSEDWCEGVTYSQETLQSGYI